MGANLINALYFLITTLFNVYLGVLVLRVILQVVKADFYNPLSQFVWKITNPLVMPLKRIVPRYKQIDTAALAVLLLVAILYVAIVSWMFSHGMVVSFLLLNAILKCLVLTIDLYCLSLFIQAILSWMGSGVNNPAANILYSLNEPVLRPIRRFIPPVSGLDISPMIAMLILQVITYLLPLDSLFH